MKKNNVVDVVGTREPTALHYHEAVETANRDDVTKLVKSSNFNWKLAAVSSVVATIGLGVMALVPGGDANYLSAVGIFAGAAAASIFSLHLGSTTNKLANKLARSEHDNLREQYDARYASYMQVWSEWQEKIIDISVATLDLEEFVNSDSEDPDREMYFRDTAMHISFQLYTLKKVIECGFSFIAKGNEMIEFLSDSGFGGKTYLQAYKRVVEKEAATIEGLKKDYESLLELVDKANYKLPRLVAGNEEYADDGDENSAE